MDQPTNADEVVVIFGKLSMPAEAIQTVKKALEGTGFKIFCTTEPTAKEVRKYFSGSPHSVAPPTEINPADLQRILREFNTRNIIWVSHDKTEILEAQQKGITGIHLMAPTLTQHPDTVAQNKPSSVITVHPQEPVATRATAQILKFPFNQGTTRRLSSEP